MDGDPTKPLSKPAPRWPAALFGGIIGALFSGVVIAAALYNKHDQLRLWLLSDDEVRLSHLEARVGEVSDRLDQLRAQSAQASREPPDTVKLEGQIAELRRAIPAEGLILRLTERVEAAERAERELTQTQAAASALLLTVGQLRDAVDRGDRFSAELAAARQMTKAEDTVLLDSFAPGAETGIARRDKLLSEFKPLREKLLQQEADSEEPGFWHALARHARKVVAIRRMDGQGNDAEAVLARTDAAFKEGEWDKAVESLGALPGPYLATADDWLHQARLRLAADRALSQLAAAAAARTAPRPLSSGLP
jgi:hypothetical protein